MAARILIVDDDPIVTEILSMCLANQGHHIIKATGPARAMNLACDPPPDCVLLDYRLGSECGLDLVDPLRQLAPDAPIIMITADESDEPVEAASALGIDRFWRKNQDLADLARHVQNALEGAAPEQPVAERLRGLDAANDPNDSR